MKLNEAINQWVKAKELEEEFRNTRYALEKVLIKLLDIDTNKEGRLSAMHGKYRVTHSTKLGYKVDAEKAKEIAAAHHKSKLLNDMFTWKAEYKKSFWNEADESLKQMFAEAITITPQKTSFMITKIEKEKEND